MKAVILAAGQGTRIRSVHGERPKCLIEVDDATILDHQFEVLSTVGIKDVVIVVGYEKEQIINHVTSRKPSNGQRIHFIENPAFAITNNVYSLWLAPTGFVATVSSFLMPMSFLMPTFLPLRSLAKGCK